MVFRVKNTTFLEDFSVFDLICIEKCRGCGDKGSVLCQRCKNYIFEHYENHCPICKKKVLRGVCSECREKEAFLAFRGIYTVGYRDEIIGELVEEYKYYAMRKIGGILGEILAKTAFLELPLGKNREVCVVPLPTARKHIRERGFDHTLKILEGAKKKGANVRILKLLERAKDTVQVGADEKTRKKQAKEAYRIDERRLRNVENKAEPIVLFDDIWTTGASMVEAAKLLKKAGFSEIYGVVLAVNRQGRKPEIRRGEV